MNFYSDIDRYEDRFAVVCQNGDRMTYKQFLSDADGILEGTKKRTLLFLVCENCIESVCAYIGALRKEIVPVMINAKIEGSLFENLCKAYRPTYLYAPKEWKNLKEADYLRLRDYRGYTLYETRFVKDYELSEELALLLTTSGSTGSPKLVRQSYRNITSNANAIADYLKIGKEDRAITTMPMSYTYCLSIINSHFLRGACMILNEYSVIQREFWSVFHREKPTTFGGVPFIYEQLKALRFGRMELDSLTYITQAGGKLSREMAEEFYGICKEKGIRMIVMYGQTEATARMSYLPWESALTKAGSIGIAIPGGQFMLIDENGEEIDAPNVVGELVYRGENVTLGYADSCYDLKLGDENHGVLYTGDMAKRDADGFYYIAGRKKRFLKMYGNRVNLDEVEELLKKQGYTCACTGEDDRLAVYVTEEGEDVSKEIKAFLSRSLGLAAKGLEVLTISEIPRNEAGKIQYSALAKG